MKSLHSVIKKIVRNAVNEDSCRNDVTTKFLIPGGQVSEAYILMKEPAVVCGLDICRMVFKQLDPEIKFRNSVHDGDKVKRMTKIACLKGKTRAILSAERVALNFLSYLSGIATTTRTFVQKVSPLKVKILDTRKTTPGLRVLERMAVRKGGGENHRYNLSDMILIKDNHKAAFAQLNLTEKIVRLRKLSKKKLEIEADNLLEFRQALLANPDIILLDNMPTAELRKAVQWKRKVQSKTLLEASGGINIKNVRSVALTGVDRISVGSLTHHLKAVDVSLELVKK